MRIAALQGRPIVFLYSKTSVLLVLALLLLVSPVLAAPSANGTVFPRYVDTSVPNQTFVYNIRDINESLTSILINSSLAYNFTNLVSIYIDGANCVLCTENSTEINRLITNFSTPISPGSVVNITFTANTAASATSGNFTLEVQTAATGRNLTTLGNITVTTQPMVVTNVSMTCTTCKATAVLNGTDYWEFQFIVGLTASQTGQLYFKMSDWIDALGQRLPINTSSVFYTTFRNEGSNLTTFNNATNVTTSYSGYLNKTGTALENYYLRVAIPAGVPVSNSWSTTYNFLYRSTP